MKNKEIFEQEIREFLQDLPAKVLPGQKIVALVGIVRTNDRLRLLGQTQFFGDTVDIDCQILAENIANEVLPYSLNSDPVYFGQSLLSLPPKMAEKYCSPVRNVVADVFAQRLANQNILTILDLAVMNKADLKGLGFNKIERGMLRLSLSKKGFRMGGLRNPNINVTPTPDTPDLPATIDICLQYVSA